MPNPIQIFKAGKHTAMSGATLTFSEADLQSMVNAYDPALHEAPIVVGHPKTDDPAYGWVKSLNFSEGVVTALPDQVDAEFAELNKQGKFKKVSASLYTPDAPNNPVPGVYYLRHVGFLGAQPPAIKGLKTAQFSDNEEGVVEFADWDKMTISNLFRKLREYIIGKDGADTADQILPDYEINRLQNNAAIDNEEDGIKSYFSETPPNNQGDEMSAEDKALLEKLQAENADLKKQNAEFAENEKAQKFAVIHKDNEAFAETLIADGKLLPVNKESTVALLDSTAAITAPIEFGEGDKKSSKHPYDLLKEQLKSSPKLVEFGQAGKGEESVDITEDAHAMAAEAVNFIESEKAAGRVINSAEAIKHVMNKHQK